LKKIDIMQVYDLVDICKTSIIWRIIQEFESAHSHHHPAPTHCFDFSKSVGGSIRGMKYPGVLMEQLTR
jgi:hypothetical protein